MPRRINNLNLPMDPNVFLNGNGEFVNPQWGQIQGDYLRQSDLSTLLANIAATPGADGRTLLNGTADPTTEGAEGDFYINTETYYIFGPKAGGVWPGGVPMMGSPTAKYAISDLDTSGATQYFGYLDKDGNWYIMKLTSTEATYVAGTSDYGTNWTGRAGLTYQDFNDVF